MSRTVVLSVLLLAIAWSADAQENRKPGDAPAEFERMAAPLTGGLREPVDESTYIVGPGDRFAVTVSLGDVASAPLAVTPEGDLVLPGVRAVPVAGETLAVAKRRVEEALATSYRNVDVDVSLVGVRVIEVHVAGQVERPGTYDVSALDVVGTVLQVAGGLAPNGSRRNIQLRFSDGRERSVDLVRYEALGDLDGNPPVMDATSIWVPFAKERVYVMGAVESPGPYELVSGDTVQSLIDIAGGLAEGARRDSIECRSFLNDYETRIEILALDDPVLSARTLENGDQVYVRFQDEQYRDIENVYVTGEVRFPGPYGINEGQDRVRDIISRAGGVTAEASLTEARLVRTSGVEEEDREFERLKTIPVQDMSETEYAYFKAKSRERKGQVVLDFRALMAGDESENHLVFRGDRVIIPRERTTITVSGAVTAPGLVNYVEGTKAPYYIASAGGFSSTADKGKTRVIKAATGEWEPVGDAGVIVPGDEIWVPERPDRDWWKLTRETVSFVASVAAIYLVIDQASRR
ncbi:MAG: SLBB domain-containing protein [bacterium]